MVYYILLFYYSISVKYICVCVCVLLSIILFAISTFAAANVLEFCADQMSLDDVWNLKSFEVSQTLQDILEIIDSWLHVCDSLTRLFWPNYAQHAWLGEPHIPKNAVAFQERLHEIKNIKNIYKDITCLFNENNQIDKSIRRIFIPFKGTYIRDTISQNKTEAEH